MYYIVEDEKSICSSLSSNRGLKSKSHLKTQKKLSFTPTQASDFKEKYQVDLDETSISSFDSVINTNESNETVMSKSVLSSSHAGTHSTRSAFLSESCFIFEEEFSELIESLRRFSRTKTVKVDKRKRGINQESITTLDLINDCSLKNSSNSACASASVSINGSGSGSGACIEKSSSTYSSSNGTNNTYANSNTQLILKQEDFQKMTNIQEIQNFNDYTNECIKLLSKITIPDISTLDNRYIHLPFANDIGPTPNKKRLAIFDLDETLIHCELKDIYSAQQIIEIIISSTMRKTVGLNVRPNMKEELMLLKSKYHLIVYTASQQKYADAVLDTIDPNNELFSYRLYRNNCTLINIEDQPLYVKDLRIFKGISMKDIVIIDNSILSFGFHLSNGVPILPYYKGTEDKELKNLRKFLEQLAGVSDIPAKLRSLMRLEESVEKCRDEEEFELDTIEELENSYASLDNSGSSSSSQNKS